MNIIPSSGSIQFEWGNMRLATNYYHLYYEPAKQLSDIILAGIPKNCGIFTEGTMYRFKLIMAYMFSCKVKPDNVKIKILFALSILSTLSVMPILSLLIFNGCLFVMKKMKNRQMETLRIILLPIILVVLLSVAIEMLTSKMTTGSYSVRRDHLTNCLKIFAMTFPFGIGFGNSDLLRQFFSYDQGLSVGIPYFLALGGLGVLLLLVIPTYRYMICAVKQHQWVDFSFAITFVWVFLCTNVVYNSTLQWFIIAVIFMQRDFDAIMKTERQLNG